MSEDNQKKNNDERNRENHPWSHRQSNRIHKGKEDDPNLWGIFLFGLIGATVTTLAVGRLRRTVDWFYDQGMYVADMRDLLSYTSLLLVTNFCFYRSQSKWKNGGSFRTNFQEEAWKRYNRRMQEEYEEELERVERIRRMQSVFNRERNKQKRGYESWKENSEGGYHQHFQREDWYWKTDTSYKKRSNFRETPRGGENYSLSHHYTVLGLSRLRTKAYTDDEIKTAFRAKAMQFHPDQNQDNKEAAEAKFKEVMTSYEAIKTERKNMK